MKRLFDILLSFLLIILFSIPALIVAIIIYISDPGPILFWSSRVGRNNQLFQMVKFRTMRLDTPVEFPLKNPHQYITAIGKLLRKTSLDELPQLYNIFIGDMSFVGPRPALYNEDELIKMRTENNLHLITPGLTGWAQVNGRDGISLMQKVKLDTHYLLNKSFLFDLKILFITFVKVIRRSDISH